jgi:UDP-glucose 4-epimerase
MDILIKRFFENPDNSLFLSKIRELDSAVFGEENSWSDYNFYKELPLKKDLSFIALSYKKIIGFLIGSAYPTNKGTAAHINRIAVDRDFRNYGVGQELIRHFENAAKVCKCVTISLEFDKKLNVDRFYVKSGYLPMDKTDDILNYLRAKEKLELQDIYKESHIMKIIVFGGAGFIGSTLLRLLHSRGHTVACADNFITGKRDNLLSEFPSFYVDISDPLSFKNIHFNPDLVIHLAFPASLCDRNIKNQFEIIASLGMLNVLEFARQTCNKIIYGSSISVYGISNNTIITEETPVNPFLLYGANKYLGELYTRSFHQQFGLQFNILRISDTFGERDLRKNAINNFIRAFIEDSSIIVNGDGEQLRTFTYVGDMANAIALSLTRLNNRTYNVSAGNAISINALLAKLKFYFKTEKIIQYKPDLKDNRNYVFDCSKFKTDFGDFELTGLDEGLLRTVEFIKTIC